MKLERPMFYWNFADMNKRSPAELSLYPTRFDNEGGDIAWWIIAPSNISWKAFVIFALVSAYFLDVDAQKPLQIRNSSKVGNIREYAI